MKQLQLSFKWSVSGIFYELSGLSATLHTLGQKSVSPAPCLREGDRPQPGFLDLCMPSPQLRYDVPSPKPPCTQIYL